MIKSESGGRLADRTAAKLGVELELSADTVTDLAAWRQRQLFLSMLAACPSSASYLAKLQRRVTEGAISPDHAAQAAAFIVGVLE